MEFTLVPSIGEDGHIKTNASELLKEIEKPLQKYNYVVTEETYSQAKTDRASLNKIATRISDERKRIENDVFKNWIQDKKDIMEVEKKIKASSAKLGEGITAIDDKEKQEKEQRIIDKWNEEVGELYNIQALWNKKWLNKSYSFADIEKDIAKAKEKIDKDILILKTFIPDDRAEQKMIFNVYRKSLDVTLAKVEADRIRDAHEQERLEAEKKKEAEQAHLNFTNGTVETSEGAEPVQQDEKPSQEEVQPMETEPIYFAQFTVEGTRDQLEALTKTLVQAQKEIGMKMKVDKKGQA
ncbi:DUF1351 domain-containing protein [Absicoccus porci]|uniref:DUF1351 domain-containing protein n=1 Tax=Absicoccus porci TaxID=2486576 RepID=A0A3N0I1A3_9FIRM|nr:DUF1351 domain-containing protein [Absicoccus porci]RNM30677.1 DUF1351 domain-containing protein [Absicoccus porci]